MKLYKYAPPERVDILKNEKVVFTPVAVNNPPRPLCRDGENHPQVRAFDSPNNSPFDISPRLAHNYPA